MGSAEEKTPTPQGPEGPFYLPKQPLRSDIREDREGIPLQMKFNVINAKTGKPIPNGEVHAWHADANGVYSAYLGLYPLENHEIKGGEHAEPTDDSQFLRGIQPTDSDGSATFQTILPGWYGERTPHIHFKVFVGGKNCYTGEVYFQDCLTEKVIEKGVKPYCDRDASTKQTNHTDPVFEKFDGEKTVVVPEGDVTVALRASLDVVVCV